MEFCYVSQAGFKLLFSRGLPALASHATQSIDIYHHAGCGGLKEDGPQREWHY